MSRSVKIKVAGVPGLHPVVETLGYQHSRGCYAKVVSIHGVERVVVASHVSGPWSINRPAVIFPLPSQRTAGGLA